MDNVIIKKDAVSAVATLCVPQVTHTLLAHNAMVRDILRQNKDFPISFKEDGKISLSVQPFAHSWLYHSSCFLQTSSYPFYLIFVLLTSPVLGIAASLAFSEVRCFVYVTDIHVHGTKDDFVTMSDKVHSKAIIKETTVMITCHTWDRCLLSQPTPSCQPTPKSY